MRGKKGARSVPPQPPPLSGGETVVLRRVEVSTGAVRGAKSEILGLLSTPFHQYTHLSGECRRAQHAVPEVPDCPPGFQIYVTELLKRTT